LSKFNKTVLCIIDGLGINNSEFGNAVRAANMVNLDSISACYPYAIIKASGNEVGLSDEKDAGNSEVGHNAIGSGQHIKQGLTLLNDVLQSGEIFTTEQWNKLADNAKKTKLNVIFLLSDGRVHSDIAHLFKLLGQCAKANISVAIHAALDGRDVPTQSAIKYINQTREFINKIGVNAKIATVAGRSILWMDRYETNTDLLANAIEVCARGRGTKSNNIENDINAEYAKNPTMTDETMSAFILEPDWLINNGDSVLLLNYRGDRAVQICNMFERGKYLNKQQYGYIDQCLFFGVLQYDTELDLPKNFLCAPPIINNTLSEYLCGFGVRQYSVTETVKFGHLTYFFNGNRAESFDKNLETWKEFKSDVLSNMYNRAPKMQAEKITKDTIKAIKSNKYDFIRLNLPNPDMVGHTGDFDAVVIACKTVDDCIGELVRACQEHEVNLIVTSDHGSAETMIDEKGKPVSSHTNNPVPFVLLPFGGVDYKIKNARPARVLRRVPHFLDINESKNYMEKSDNFSWVIKDGEFGLTNIAATICKLLGIEPSKHFNKSMI